MHPAIEQAFEFCADNGIDSVTIVAPFELYQSEIEALKAHPAVKRLTAIPPSDATAVLDDNWFQPYDISKPTLYDRAPGTGVLFLSGLPLLALKPLLVEVLRGRFTLECRAGGAFRRYSVGQIFAARMESRFADWLRQKPDSSWPVRLVSASRKIGSLRRFWRSASGRRTTTADKHETDAEESMFIELAQCACVEAADFPAVPSQRIVHVNAGMTAGGVERQICLTLAGLKEAGFNDLTLLAEFPTAVSAFPPYTAWLNRIAVPIQPVPKARPRTLWGTLPSRSAAVLSQLPPHLVSEILALSAEFRRLQPKIVHAWQDATCIRAGFAALLAGVPRIILSGRNTDPSALPTHQPFMRPAYRALLQQQNVAMIINSAVGARSYADWLSIDVARFEVIHNAFDPTMFDRSRTGTRSMYAIPETSRVVGSAFRFLPQKRPLLWIEAAARVALESPDTHFLIVGEGPLETPMRDRVEELGLSDRFHFGGRITDMSGFYATLDLFVLASEREGLPNVLLEAQWHAVPVICTDAGGIREAIYDGVTGKVVDPATPERLATEILSGLTDETWRHKATQEAPAFVEKAFSLDKMIDQTRALYEAKPPR